jgi:peptide/nickel transport system substrate-binding protein
MKRPVFILVALLMVAAMIITGCPTPAPPAPPAEEPQYGGILRIAVPFGPRVLGYLPDMGFTDLGSMGPYAEALLNTDGKGNLIPELATSWDSDITNKTITWHLRQGVKFHDGTDWNAEAAKWTFQIMKDAGRLQYGELITSMEVIDNYTLRFNLTEYSNRLIHYLGKSVYFFSPTAFETNGKEWARTHPVATGPFKLVDFKRDSYWKLEKNENYWRPDRPYLDGIDVRVIPQEMTASASLQAGEVDYWGSPNLATTVLDLQEKGFKYEASGLFFLFLMPDVKNPDSIFANKKVREAVEYAINREALAKAATGGLGGAAYQMAPSTAAAVYDPDYKGRQYDPEKAKQLLAEAGYATGFKTTIHVLQQVVDYATAVQSDLAAVGIEAKVDSTDMARLMTVVAEGWDELLIYLAMVSSPDYVTPFINNFGPTPTTPIFASFGRTPEYEALCEQVKSARDDKSEQAIVKKMIRQLGEDATVIPLFTDPSTPVWQPYVHPYRYPETGMLGQFYSEWWMEKH